MASATANNLLFPCLDFRRELPMEYCFEDCAPIKIHPECVFFATANLGGQYTGTHKLDRALMDRFMLVEIDPLQEAQVKLKRRYNKVMKFQKEFEEFKKSQESFLAIMYNPKDNNNILAMGLKCKESQKQEFIANQVFYPIVRINRKVINLDKIPKVLADNSLTPLLFKGKITLIPLQGFDDAT